MPGRRAQGRWNPGKARGPEDTPPRARTPVTCRLPGRSFSVAHGHEEEWRTSGVTPTPTFIQGKSQRSQQVRTR